MQLTFDHPIWLSLTLLLPIVAWHGFRHLKSFGMLRRLLSVSLRVIVMLAIILAVAGVSLRRTSDQITVVYVLDQSASIDPSMRTAMYDYARQSVAEHRNKIREDLAGVIVFGAAAVIEIPPFGDDLPRQANVGFAGVRDDATNLEEALTLATSAMPPDTQRRIVVFTDGNENKGNVQRVAASIKASGIGIDFVAVPTQSGSDVMVQRIDMPTNIRPGQPIEARVLVEAVGLAAPDQAIEGRLRITRRSGGEDELLIEESIRVVAGKNVFPLRHEIATPAPYTYTAQFIAERSEQDSQPKNNLATAFVNVQGKSRVLMIVAPDQRDQWNTLTRLLAHESIEVVTQTSDSMFGSIAELQAYDAVILADLPRVSGDSERSISLITDDQIAMLVRNTQQLGAGLLMIGGPDALGAGGWTGTELEKAMPVDFEINNLKVDAVGALALVIDSSGSMDGEKMRLCKAAAQQAVKMLSPTDFISITAFDSEPHQIIPIQKVAGRTHMLPMIAKIQAGGGTDMYPAMQQAFVGLARTEASVKHMIVLTDGQTQPGDFDGLMSKVKTAGITVSSVAIGQGADTRLMNQIATRGGGKMFHVLSPRAIPQILMRESRRVSRPLIYENNAGITPTIAFPHALLSGIDAPPPIRGYVMTTAKDSSLAQSLIVASGPHDQTHAVLAVWPYGLGRAAVLTTDAGQRWASDWVGWDGQSKLFAQLVRWLMRPSGDSGQLAVDAVHRDGNVQVVVNALDASDNYVNFLDPVASVLDPNLKPISVSLQQTAPGRYVGSFSPDLPGSYLIQVAGDSTARPITTAVSVSATQEYRSRETNLALLNRIARAGERHAGAGEVVTLTASNLQPITSLNPYRGGLPVVSSVRDAWPLLVLLGCCLFFADVLVRRIAIRWEWLGGRAPRPSDAMQRDSTRIARLDSLQQVKRATFGRAQASGDQLEQDAAAPEPSYSERLLRAKREARSSQDSRR